MIGRHRLSRLDWFTGFIVLTIICSTATELTNSVFWFLVTMVCLLASLYVAFGDVLSR
jgi:hypothetical protein